MALNEKIKTEIMFRSNNRCCVCQVPFIDIHHIDGNRDNNELDNLIALCPNCHSQAHSKSKMTNNLTPERLKKMRDKWYEYCEIRKSSISFISQDAIFKLIMFIRKMGFPQYGWEKTFGYLSDEYKQLTREEIARRVFSTSNLNDIKTCLEAVENMYGNILHKHIEISLEARKEFKELCNSFGFDYDLVKRKIL